MLQKILNMTFFRKVKQSKLKFQNAGLSVELPET